MRAKTCKKNALSFWSVSKEKKFLFKASNITKISLLLLSKGNVST